MEIPLVDVFEKRRQSMSIGTIAIAL